MYVYIASVMQCTVVDMSRTTLQIYCKTNTAEQLWLSSSNRIMAAW